MSQNLPDPRWSEAASFCVSCGYPLDGMPAPWNCPECGTPYEARQLVLHGVPNFASTGSPLRKALRVYAILDAVAIAIFWPAIIFFAWPLLVFMIVSLLGIGIFDLSTNRRRPTGVERFVITPTGVARMPMRQSTDPVGSIFLAFNNANDLDWKQISPFWARVRVGTRSRGRLSDVMFDAGVRCPQEIGPVVVAEIRSRIRARQDAASPVVQ